VHKVIDTNSLDQVFVDDVLYLFDQGENIGRIAYIMNCDMATVDAILCDAISVGTMELT
jgi:hypothetical protein